MNDLERDLRETFEQRARRMDAPVAASPILLRRGRRRQIRTVALGAVATVVTILIMLGVSNFMRTPVDAVPGEPNGLPARATSIGGVTVTAPAGWTLVDDTPLLNVVATSAESCSFSAGGAAVDQNGSPVAVTSSTPTSSCGSEQTTAYSGGVPFLQLANFEIPLTDSVCPWGSEPSTDLPDDGVAVFVGAFPAGYDSSTVLDTCPGARRYMEMSDGTNGYTFILRDTTGGNETQLPMAAIAVAGPNASAGDVDVVRAFFGQQFFGEASPLVRPDPSRVGPGYVLAAGGTASEGWRLEAGIKGYAEGGRPMAASIFTTMDHETETAKTDATFFNSEDVETVGDQVIQHGNLASGFAGVSISGTEGTVTTAEIYPWPRGLLDVVQSQPLENAGGVWVAAPPGEGEVEFLRGGTSTASSTASPSSRDQLQTKMDSNGGLVVYGNDLGHHWELSHENGSNVLTVDGNLWGSFPMVNGEWREFDVDGGSYVVGIFDASIDRLFVATDPEGSTGTTLEGGSIPSQDTNGEQGRVWFIPLAGTGSGTLRAAGDATPLGWHITWPAQMDLRSGSVLRAGGNGISYSWALTWRDDHCVQLQWQIPSSAWMGGCFPPWSDLQLDGGTPLVGGQYATGTGDLSGIVIVLPAEATIDRFDTDGSGPNPDCTTIRVESNFAGTQFCVFPLAVGSSATVLVGGMGDMASPIRVTARPGRIELTQSDALTLSPSPSP